jgi:hypothetical protein
MRTGDKRDEQAELGVEAMGHIRINFFKQFLQSPQTHKISMRGNKPVELYRLEIHTCPNERLWPAASGRRDAKAARLKRQHERKP